MNDYSGSDRHSARAMCCCRVSATLVKSSSTDLSLLDSRWSGIGAPALAAALGHADRANSLGVYGEANVASELFLPQRIIPLDEIGQKLWLRMIEDNLLAEKTQSQSSFKN